MCSIARGPGPVGMRFTTPCVRESSATTWLSRSAVTRATASLREWRTPAGPTRRQRPARSGEEPRRSTPSLRRSGVPNVTCCNRPRRRPTAGPTRSQQSISETSARPRFVVGAWTSRGGSAVVWARDGHRPGGTRARARRAARRRLRPRGSLPHPLAAGVPRGLPRHPRCGGRGGHRAGVLPRGAAGTRPVRPPTTVRAVAAPDRRQPLDRLGSCATAARRGRAHRVPLGARAEPASSRRRARRTGAPRAGAPRRGRDALPARVHAGRDRRGARDPAWNRQLAPAAGLDALEVGGENLGGSCEARAPARRDSGRERGRERAWAVLETAFEDRAPTPQRSHWPRVAAVAIALAAIVASAASPPGQAVIDEIREVVGVERAERLSSPCLQTGGSSSRPTRVSGSSSPTARSGCWANTARPAGRRSAASSSSPGRTSWRPSNGTVTSAGLSRGQAFALHAGREPRSTHGSPT